MFSDLCLQLQNLLVVMRNFASYLSFSSVLCELLTPHNPWLVEDHVGSFVPLDPLFGPRGAGAVLAGASSPGDRDALHVPGTLHLGFGGLNLSFGIWCRFLAKSTLEHLGTGPSLFLNLNLSLPAVDPSPSIQWMSQTVFGPSLSPPLFYYPIPLWCSLN